MIEVFHPVEKLHWKIWKIWVSSITHTNKLTTSDKEDTVTSEMYHIVSGNGFEISLNFVPRVVVVEFINMQIICSTMAIDQLCDEASSPPLNLPKTCVLEEVKKLSALKSENWTHWKKLETLKLVQYYCQIFKVNKQTNKQAVNQPTNQFVSGSGSHQFEIWMLSLTKKWKFGQMRRDR